MALCRALLSESNAALTTVAVEPPVSEAGFELQDEEATERCCPRCGATMVWFGKLSPAEIRAYLAASASSAGPQAAFDLVRDDGRLPLPDS